MRFFLLLSIVLCTVSLFAAGPIRDVESTENVLPEFPKFQYKGIVFGCENLKYRPHDDFTFVSVFPAHQFLDKPLGNYYMYYSAHDAPGGICLAFADNIAGPWTEYESNPLIAKDWEPYYKVSHVAAPDAVWIEKEKKLFVYFHGENNTTRYATSTDGIRFEYGGTAVDLSRYGIIEASYARTHEFAMPDKNSQYIMIFMGNDKATFQTNPIGTRMCYLATSIDGRTWESGPSPLLTPPPGTDQISPGCYLRWKNRNFIIASANLLGTNFDPVTNLYLYELGRKTPESETPRRSLGPWNRCTGASAFQFSDDP